MIILERVNDMAHLYFFTIKKQWAISFSNSVKKNAMDFDLFKDIDLLLEWLVSAQFVLIIFLVIIILILVSTLQRSLDRPTRFGVEFIIGSKHRANANYIR